MIGTLSGVRQVVVPSGDRVYAVRPEDGSLLWQFEAAPFASLLLLPGDRVLVGQFTGLVMLQVRREGETWSVVDLWRASTFKSPYTPLVHFDGSLYGFNGFLLVCLDARSGDLRWRERLYTGSLIVVDGHLIVLGRSSGQIRVIEASSEAFKERWKVPVFQAGATSYTPPSFASGRIFVRNLEEIVAVDVAPGTARRTTGEGR